MTPTAAALPSEIQIDKTGKGVEQIQAKEKQSMFILYFRQGQNPHTVFTFFFDSGPFNQIVSRAKDFCETMNMRFVTVKPAITNFEEEKKKLGRDI